jgi:hypothetical protein
MSLSKSKRMHILNQQVTVVQIISAYFTIGEVKNLASILFFISLLTILSGIILKMALLLNQCIEQIWQDLKIQEVIE